MTQAVQAGSTPDPALTLCAELGDATASLSSYGLWGYTFVIVLLALLPVALIARNLRLARRARAARKGHESLRPGPIVVHGMVDHPRQPPLRVEITQTGTKLHLPNDSGWYQWTETGRNTQIAPFVLQLASGDALQVIPDDASGLLLDMDRTKAVSTTTRRRIAEVRDGDTIHVSGRLEVSREVDPTAGYRGSATRKKLTLRPAGHGGMLVSRKPLEDVFRRPLSAYARALAFLAAALIAVHGLYFGFHVRAHGGQVVPGEVVDKREVVNREDHTKTYEVDVRLPDGTVLNISPTTACYQRVDLGQHVPVLRPSRFPSLWQIGSSPSVHLLAVAGGFVVLVVGFILSALTLRASRRWHGGSLLDEEDSPPVG